MKAVHKYHQVYNWNTETQGFLLQTQFLLQTSRDFKKLLSGFMCFKRKSAKH